MNNSICGEDVRCDHFGIPGVVLDDDLAWTKPCDKDLITPCCPHGGFIPQGQVFGLNINRNNVAEKHSCQGVLIIEEVFQGVLINLGKSIIGGGEDGEETLAREGFDQVGSLDGGKEGRELRSGSGQLCDGLRRLVIVIVVVIVIVIVIIILLE